MKKLIVISTASLLMVACATPGETEGGLREGQWSPVQPIGTNKFIVEGFHTQDAVKGGTAYCEKKGLKFDTLIISPATSRDRATITFRCI